MQYKIFMLSGFLAIFSTSIISAQGSASVSANRPTILESSQFSISPDEWAFYLDEENKVYYIDFESISVNLNDIKVVDQAGKVVKSDKLWDLPVNTIYELSVKDLAPGNYKVELRTYTGLIEKEITVSK